MKTKVLLIIVLMFLGGTLVYAQKSKIKPKPKPKRDNTVSIMEMGFEQDESGIVPQLKDFAYVVEIDKNSNIGVTIQTSEDVKFLTNTADIKPLGDFFSGAATGGKTAKTAKTAIRPIVPIVIVRAQPHLNFGVLFDVINKIRSSSKLRIKLETAPSYYVLVQAIDTTPLRLRPNPLSLVVSLDRGFNIKLNMEPLGTLKETKAVTDRLIEIFKAREENGVYREGSNEVEKTVFVSADRSVDFKDVIELIEVIRAAGASPIGLQMDEINFVLQVEDIN